ncbi:MAG: MFS transporter [Desulfobacterales bacterium]|nr:MAG: MFS transporter [Desulfobacterales bacterium]
MQPSKKSPSKLRIFYGWYILAGCFFLLFFQSGARHSFGVMFKPMIAQLGWDRASISLAFFLNMTIFALTLTVAGRFYDRYGPKWVIFISTLFLSTGYVCISFIDTLWEFHIYYGIVAAIGVGGASVSLVAALTSKWFEKRRGLAISLAVSGNCIGQFALVPLFTIFVIKYDWRVSYFLIGLIILVVNTILAFAVIKGDPHDFGLKPRGHADQYDISPTTAGNLLAWFGLMSMGGILVAGPLSDLIGNKIPVALTFLLRIFLFLLILKYQNLISFYAFAIAFGFTFLITAPLTATLLGRLFGFGHVGLLSGFTTTVHHFGGGFWAFMGGLVFDRTGSYQMIFICSAILALIAFICTMFIKEKRHLVGCLKSLYFSFESV